MSFGGIFKGTFSFQVTGTANDGFDIFNVDCPSIQDEELEVCITTRPLNDKKTYKIIVPLVLVSVSIVLILMAYALVSSDLFYKFKNVPVLLFSDLSHIDSNFSFPF